MHDTLPEVESKLLQMTLARSGEERFLSGIRSFEAARAIVISSLPNNLSEDEFNRRLFERIYGKSIEETIGVVRDGPED